MPSKRAIIASSAPRPGSDGQPGPNLSSQMEGFRKAHQGQAMTLGRMVEELGENAHLFLAILVCLPVCVPLPIPGASMLFGYIAAVIGFRLAFAFGSALPERLLNRTLSPKMVDRMLGAAQKFFHFLEKLLKPRLGLFMKGVVWSRVYGLLICTNGWLLFLPLPIPFTNLLPAAAIICMAGAMLERDGLMGMVGMILSAVTIVYFAALAVGSVMTVDIMVDGKADLRARAAPKAAFRE